MARQSPQHRKRLGQIFLRHTLVVDQILQSAALAPEETVLEIGPGRGILTTALARHASALYALEIDAHYVRTLQQHFASLPHVRIIQADARFYDYGLLPQPLAVVANLPYSMGMAILHRLLAFRQRLSRLVIMLQEEVAQRLLAPPATSAYGALSVFFQYYAAITHNFDVSRHAFTPVPAVDSTVLTLVPFAAVPWPAPDEDWLWRLVKCAFAHRRKTLRANLLAAFPGSLTPIALAEILTRCGFGTHVRAQELHVRQFVQLAEDLRHLQLPGRDAVRAQEDLTASRDAQSGYDWPESLPDSTTSR
jgi:16S rRNA (adenine1518-N6/adenine1519-N6)-dimethyltransferase